MSKTTSALKPEILNELKSSPVEDTFVKEIPAEIEISPETEPEKEEGRDLYYLDYIMAAIGSIIITICWLLGFTENQENILFNVILLIGSLCLLLGASDIVLEYAVKIAEFMGISELIIGLTIVSLGTSIPEMFTAIASAKEGIGAFVISDIYGSYITQLTLFLGIVILCDRGTVSLKFVPNVKRDGFLVICAVLFLSFNILDGHLTRMEAWTGISIYIIYVLYLYIDSQRKPSEAKKDLKKEADLTELERIFTKEELAQRELKNVIENPEATPIERDLAIALKESAKPKKWLILPYFGMILLGVFACYFGAKYVVFSGSDLAYAAKVPTQVVAATIVGFGTGFPEFVVSMMAVRRRKLDIAYGNLIGSNIVDPCVSVSLGALTSEIYISRTDLWGILGKLLPIALVVDLFIIFAFNRKESTKKFGTIVGFILIATYAFFLIFSLTG